MTPVEKKAAVHHGEVRYANFMMLRLDPAFRRLMSNERIAAKQELENMVSSVQENVFLRTYSLLGLEADCDMLLWMASQDLRAIQTAWARIAMSGAGTYLSPTQCYIGIYTLPDPPSKKDAEGGIPQGLFGKNRYMLMHPLVRSHTWYELSDAERNKFLGERQNVLARYPGVTEHFFYSCGLDDQEFIVVREADAIEDLAQASRELREQRIKMFTRRDTPSMLCVGTDLRDILDSLG
jgi:chlorite dismutase